MGSRTGGRRSVGWDLYLIVEATSDYTFWNAHLTKHFPKARKVVDNLCSSDPAHAFDRIMEVARVRSFRHIVFLVDEDASPDPAVKVKRLEARLTSLRRTDPHIADRVRVFGVRRCLEAWLLADEEAIRGAFPRCRYRRRGKTDLLIQPKREAKRIHQQAFADSPSWNEIEFARRMVCRVDFQRASQGSVTFAAFWKEMGPVFSAWH
jgi:hypothetical protein